MVYFAVKTDDGHVTTDSAVVDIVNRPPKVDAGPDIVSRPGRELKLVGRGTDDDKDIIRYEWDFNGDGFFDWQSKDSAVVKHTFPAFVKPVLRVTDSQGASVTDTMRVVICPDGMVTMEKDKYCIDTYEWPNKEGTIPAHDITFDDAQKSCQKAGKRLCTLGEYQSACTGDNPQKKYPYGNWFDVDRCNTFGNAHSSNKASKSGAFEECVSAQGVHDMVGNVAEWTSTGSGDTRAVAGGWWQNGEGTSQCGSFVSLQADHKYFYAGFRCCK